MQLSEALLRAEMIPCEKLTIENHTNTLRELRFPRIYYKIGQGRRFSFPKSVFQIIVNVLALPKSNSHLHPRNVRYALTSTLASLAETCFNQEPVNRWKKVSFYIEFWKKVCIIMKNSEACFLQKDDFLLTFDFIKSSSKNASTLEILQWRQVQALFWFFLKKKTKYNMNCRPFFAKLSARTPSNSFLKNVLIFQVAC